MNPESDNSILDNIANDADLDYRVETSLDRHAYQALSILADTEHGGNRAAAVRAAIMTALRTRYLLAE